MMMMNSTIIIYNRSLSSVSSAARFSSRSFLHQSPLRWQQGKDATKNILHRHNFSSSSSAQATAASTATGSSGSNNTIGKIFFPSLCAITFTLGTWQTQRYFEKIDLVQKRKDDLSLDPLSFDQWRLNHDNHVGASSGSSSSSSSSSSGSNGEEASKKSYRRVIIQGKFDHTNSILIGPRGPPPGALATSGPNSGLGGGGGGMSSSLQGYWVITPLVVGGEEEENRLDESSSLSNEEDVSSRKEGWLDRLLPWKRRNNNQSNNTSDQLSHDLKSGSADTNSTMSTKKQSSSDKPSTTTVWINRGWIPRHYINPNTNQILQSWEEPKEHVTVLSMESQTEKGRGMFTPPSRVDVGGGKSKGSDNNRNGTGVNNDTNTIKKLLWMDREAMEEMTNCSTNDHPPLFVQINTTTSATDDNNNMNTKTESKISFPVQPSEEYVGEFKVTPDVHMGYAITWFGLSGAGVIMTRKLLTRGR